MKYIPAILVALIIAFVLYTLPLLLKPEDSATKTSEILGHVVDKRGNKVADVSPDGTMVVLHEGRTVKDYKRYAQTVQ